jgi:hypothetical protein
VRVVLWRKIGPARKEKEKDNGDKRVDSKALGSWFRVDGSSRI